jgi:hypothetical protein
LPGAPLGYHAPHADVAQLVEQPIRNRQVRSSILRVGTRPLVG